MDPIAVKEILEWLKMTADPALDALWDLAVKQVHVELIFASIWSVIFTIIFLYSSLVAYPERKMDEDGFAMLATSIVIFICGFGLVFALSKAINILVNPDWVVLEMIIKLGGGQ